ncbi:phosphopantetheine-binding protein [Paenibacillus curdlanolyticus YK9]|uniref:Phosphopantetheine-binding protein n=1 Tax=Paenibacillus curdlanolyticus YK9 TaxID=717606 RepID=E0I5B5_9BACL|nr:acyl carrier protein [Paenibacillus curdlanolyticus]EFM12157.1 phosphopantetheine-binding protein [Paenibacillus curdlanolyticus YK9]
MVTDPRLPSLRQAVAELLGRSDLSQTLDENESLQSLGLDSVKLINLVIMIEKQYAVMFDDSELLNENFDTLNKIMAKIDEKAGARA